MADGSVIIDSKVDGSGLESGLSNLSKLASGAIGGLTKIIAAAGTALVGLGTYATKVGSDFEYAMSNVAATMGTTVDQISAIEEKAKQLGASTRFSATEAADGFNILAQSGLKAEEQLSTIDSVLSLAAAGEMQMSDAAAYVTTTMKAMSIAMDEAGSNANYVADIYAKGATLANTSTAQFGEAMVGAASVAGAYNQSLETTGTALLLLAEKGYQGSAAGTYLSRALSDLYAPSANAAKALDELGIATYDAQGNQRDFLAIVNDLNAAFATMTEEEKAAYTGTIFTTAGLKAFNSIAANSEEQIAGLTEKLVDCTGAAQQMADTKLDNLQGSLTILKSASEGFGISLYNALNSGETKMKDFVDFGTGLINQLQAAVDENGLAGLADAVGGVLAQAVTKIASYVPEFLNMGTSLITSLLDGLCDNADMLADVAVSVGTSLVNGLFSVSNSLMSAGSQLIILLVNSITENMPSLLSAFADGFGSLISTISETAPQLVAAGTQMLQGLAQGISETLPGLATQFTEGISSLVISLWNALPDFVSAGADVLQAIIEGITSSLPTLVAAIPKVLTSVIQALREAIPTLLTCAEEIVNTIAEALPELVTALIEAIPGLVQLIVDTLVELVPTLIETVTNIVFAIVEALPEIIMSIIEVLPTLVQSICDGLIELLPQLIAGVMLVVTMLIEQMPTIITMICSALPTLITSIVGTLLDAIPQIVACGIALIVSLVSALPEIITAICDAIPMIIDALIVAFNELAPLIVDAGIDLFVALIKDLPTIITTIIAATGDIINEIIWAVMDSIPLLIEAGIDLLCALVAALPEIILVLVAAIPTIIASLIDAILGSIGLIAEAGVNLLIALVMNLPHIIWELLKAIPKILAALVEGIIGGVSSMAEAGGELIKGLWEGISGKADWIGKKIKSFCKNALDAIKSFFGIQSPSKVFKDIVGKNLMLGLADGIAEEASAAINATMDAAQDIADVDFSVKAPDVSGVDYDALVGSARGVVTYVGQETGTVTSSSVASGFYRNGEVSGQESGDTTEGAGKPEYIQNDIYLDGKKTARILTPYVAKELAWED